MSAKATFIFFSFFFFYIIFFLPVKSSTHNRTGARQQLSCGAAASHPCLRSTGAASARQAAGGGARARTARPYRSRVLAQTTAGLQRRSPSSPGRLALSSLPCSPWRRSTSSPPRPADGMVRGGARARLAGGAYRGRAPSHPVPSPLVRNFGRKGKIPRASRTQRILSAVAARRESYSGVERSSTALGARARVVDERDDGLAWEPVPRGFLLKIICMSTAHDSRCTCPHDSICYELLTAWWNAV